MHQITNLLKDLEVQQGCTWCNTWERLALKDMAGQVKANGSSACGEIGGSRLSSLNAACDLKVLAGIQAVSVQILNLGLTIIGLCISAPGVSSYGCREAHGVIAVCFKWRVAGGRHLSLVVGRTASILAPEAGRRQQGSSSSGSC